MAVDMNKGIELGKAGLGFVVGAGVAQIVNGFVEAVTAPETPMQRVLVFAGKTGLSMVVTDIVKDHMNSKIDNALDWCAEALTK